MRPLQAWAGRSEHAHLHSLARGQSHRAPIEVHSSNLQVSIMCCLFCYLSFIRKLPQAPGWGVPPGAQGAGLLSVPRSFLSSLQCTSLLSSVHASQCSDRVCAPTRHADPGSLRPTALTNFRTCHVAAASARGHGGKNGNTADTIHSASRHVASETRSARRRDLPRTHCIASTWSWWR